MTATIEREPSMEQTQMRKSEKIRKEIKDEKDAVLKLKKKQKKNILAMLDDHCAVFSGEAVRCGGNPPAFTPTGIGKKKGGRQYKYTISRNDQQEYELSDKLVGKMVTFYVKSFVDNKGIKLE